MVIFQVLFLKYMAYIKTNFPWNRNGPKYMHSKDNNDDSYTYLPYTYTQAGIASSFAMQ